jgi:hypothetical protein
MFIPKKVVACVALTMGLSGICAIASDFILTSLPKFETNPIDLPTGKTFFDFMKGELAGKMNGKRQDGNDDDLLRAGKAIAVKLNETNYNLHVNYFNSPQSGRSYGWSQKTVGDWSDREILTHVVTVAQGSDAELTDFYVTLVELVGSCDAKTLSKLSGMTERVATNFLAIYGAEEYRATLGTKNWDDALFETMMLAAFHAGQKKVTKFYMGKFTDRSFEQAPGIYNSRGPIAKKPDPKTEKDAELIDYWQYTPNPTKHDSGINETRPDFEKMGEAITAFEKNNTDVKALEAIVKGNGRNVIKDVTEYYANGNANASTSEDVAKHVASFLIQARQDAQKITDGLSKTAPSNPEPAPKQPKKPSV